MIKFPASAVTLALLGLVFSVPAHPQPLALEGILRSEHQQQTLELRRQQDEYRGRKGVQNLSPAKRRRLEDLLFGLFIANAKFWSLRDCQWSTSVRKNDPFVELMPISQIIVSAPK
jgi:hypothetical protein